MAKPTKRKGSRPGATSERRPAGAAAPAEARRQHTDEGGTRNRRPRPTPTKRTTPPATGRYTPPVPRSEKVSPIWVPILMFACLGLGMLVIILNYVNLLPGSDPSNTYLMIGLGLITLGFITATRYH